MLWLALVLSALHRMFERAALKDVELGDYLIAHSVNFHHWHIFHSLQHVRGRDLSRIRVSLGYWFHTRVQIFFIRCQVESFKKKITFTCIHLNVDLPLPFSSLYLVLQFAVLFVFAAGGVRVPFLFCLCTWGHWLLHSPTSRPVFLTLELHPSDWANHDGVPPALFKLLLSECENQDIWLFWRHFLAL